MDQTPEESTLGQPGVEYDYNLDPSKLAEKLEVKPLSAEEEAMMTSFFKDVTEAQRSGEIERILSCFKLNPYDFLNLRFDATIDEVKKQYRKLSLLVHPDKCSHPRARDAFAALGQAHDWLVDEERRRDLGSSINHAKELVRAERKKEVKSDAALLAQSRFMQANNMVSDYEQSDAFHLRWKKKAQEVMAQMEWRRRKMTLRIKEEEERVTAEEKAERKERKRKKKEQEAWDQEEKREERVASWRDFQTKKSKKIGKRSGGELKPPKLKQEDSDRSYVQRPVNARSEDEQKKKNAPTRVFQ